ncbi:MAG: M48 family metalloprotease [Streptosporangiaceae bacterium]
MMLLEDDRPAVYCVPARRRIVFTTGALRRLDSPQLDAVLAHERAHLAGRRHLVIILATSLRGARRAHRLTLARALLTWPQRRCPPQSSAPGAPPGPSASSRPTLSQH